MNHLISSYKHLVVQLPFIPTRASPSLFFNKFASLPSSLWPLFNRTAFSLPPVLKKPLTPYLFFRPLSPLAKQGLFLCSTFALGLLLGKSLVYSLQYGSLEKGIEIFPNGINLPPGQEFAMLHTVKDWALAFFAQPSKATDTIITLPPLDDTWAQGHLQHLLENPALLSADTITIPYHYFIALATLPILTVGAHIYQSCSSKDSLAKKGSQDLKQKFPATEKSDDDVTAQKIDATLLFLNIFENLPWDAKLQQEAEEFIKILPGNPSKEILDFLKSHENFEGQASAPLKSTSLPPQDFVPSVTEDLFKASSFEVANAFINDIEFQDHMYTDAPNYLKCKHQPDLPLWNPIIASDGHSYNRQVFMEWIEKNGAISPVTNKPLESFVGDDAVYAAENYLLNNLGLRNLIEKYNQNPNYETWTADESEKTLLTQKIQDHFHIFLDGHSYPQSAIKEVEIKEINGKMMETFHSPSLKHPIPLKRWQNHALEEAREHYISLAAKFKKPAPIISVVDEQLSEEIFEPTSETSVTSLALSNS